jgi:acetoin utilization deacetylase AcuC-like enzyme
MQRTGIFFHYQDGERLRDFPQALTGILDKDNVFLYDAFYPLKPPSSFELEPISEDILYRVHTPDMVNQIKKSQVFEGALFSAAGTVAAVIWIWQGEIDNAFVFTGYGDHHSGTNFFGGGCYFNGAAVAIRELRQRFGAKRLAIVDTDAHHGDGTWEIFKDDSGTLYVCFCAGSSSETNNKVNVHVPWQINDAQYLDVVKQNFIPRVAAFQPQAIFWNWGYDGTQGDYGDIGISPDTHIRLAQEFKRAADQLCQGRLIVVLCGGSRRDLARYLIPAVIRVLAGQGPAP